ncbi:hypothetical protein Ahy_A02g009659 [Arachis hypogaea]|uniref:Uncharacterized protein n=1 Tax=Arachis hypogaea TaxID=3818 RepID=A0A445EHR0_ARAHY|nr:hypothetical protein Ahy_A02g009659 [Arachis hypogaea]
MTIKIFIHYLIVEYSVILEKSDDGYYHIKKINIPMKKSGSLIYTTAHIHSKIVNTTYII